MKQFFKYISIFMLLGLVGVSNTGCGGGSSDGASDLYLRIYTMAAQNGALTAAVQQSGIDPASTGQAGTFTLTLTDLYSPVFWFTDRPFRYYGQESAASYIMETWPGVYGQTDPNAVIQFYLADTNDVEGVFGVLSNPVYDSKTGVVTFQVSILNSTFGGLGASLALSDVVITVLNNEPSGGKAMSFAQYTQSAILESAGTDGTNGGYNLILDQVDDEVFWLENAPGLYSYADTTAAFINQWGYLFAASAPNAALYGTDENGNLKLLLLTLSDPVYDTVANQLTYKAELLEQGDQSPGALTLSGATLIIDAAEPTSFPIPGQGAAYQAFGHGYDPSTANDTKIYFGSDITRKEMGSLWGTQSFVSETCSPNCRNDLQTLKNMGINLVRLYDWDPANDHSQFLDYAHQLGIKVVVAISNWLPQFPEFWDAQVPGYFKKNNFGNSDESDWHPAVAGVMISNEPYGDPNLKNRFPDVIGLVARFLQEAETKGYSKDVLVGIPLVFQALGPPYAANGGNMPCWNQFNQILTDPRIVPYKEQIMLNPNTYNDKTYLFESATENPGQGWVQQTYEKFQTPIFITELGKSRQNPDFSPSYVKDQLSGAVEYQKQHPDQLLGAAHFQFSNKVWKQTPNDSDSEGAFGSFSHGATVMTINFQSSEFHYPAGHPANEVPPGSLAIDKLEKTPTYDPVVEAYE